MLGNPASQHLPSVPVLMYHSISSAEPRNDLCLTPEKFEQQVIALKERGFSFITASELIEGWNHKKSLPPHPLVLTFDDGYLNQYNQAYQILKRYQIKMTLFISTGYIGKAGYVTWEQLEEMKASGLVDIQSHGVHHFDLTTISSTALVKELTESKQVLEERLHQNVNVFCYPSGKANLRVENNVSQAHYQIAFGIKKGRSNPNFDQYNLQRIRVDAFETLAAFKQKMEHEF
ncbi:polysaccharide deacetylase family protein [Paenibacillus cremeus]|nr:polysaccharide deacetylase family protein [Paenibacillus cremeus]